VLEPSIRGNGTGRTRWLNHVS